MRILKFNESNTSKLWSKIDTNSPWDYIRSYYKGFDPIPFTDRQISKMKELSKGYRVPVDTYLSNGSTIFENDIIKNVGMHLKTPNRNIYILRDLDDYYFVLSTTQTAYRSSNTLYRCDEFQGVIDLVTGEIFKNMKTQDYDTEKLRRDILNKVRTADKDILLKVTELLKNL